MARHFLLLFLLGFSRFSFPADCTQIFEQAYRECYGPYQCGTNVFRLLSRFNEQSVDLSRFDVVFLDGAVSRVAGGPLMRQTFRVTPNRAGASNFRAHFLVLENATGLVYDMDFLKQPVRIDQYAKNTFGESQLPEIRARRLGAHQYFSLIHSHTAYEGKQMGPVLNAIRTSQEWPETSLQEVLNHFPN